MHLFPAIDLRDGRVVRLAQGDYEHQTTYGSDPLEQAKAFEDAGCTWVHVVDLDGARVGRVEHLTQVEAICQHTSLKVELGGGIRSEGSIEKLLAIGVERVVLGTAALKNWQWFEKLMGNPGYRGRLVLGLDAKDGKLAVAGWEDTTELDALDVARRVNDWPLAAIAYTDIATDGMMTGPNLPAVVAMARATDVPIVASGGVGTLEHLQQLSELPLQGVIVGRAFYEQAFSVEAAIDILEGERPDRRR